MPTYKLDDIVELSEHCRLYYKHGNETARITSIGTDNTPSFQSNDGNRCWGSSCLVGLAKLAEPQYAFQKGDRVKIIQRKAGNRTGCEDNMQPNGDVGKIGYVTDLSMINGSLPYCVHAEAKELSRYYGWFAANDLELCPLTVQDKFKPSQKVRVKHIGNYSDHRTLGIGAICTVDSVDESHVRVKWPDGGRYSTFYGGQNSQGIDYFLELVDEKMDQGWVGQNLLIAVNDPHNITNGLNKKEKTFMTTVTDKIKALKLKLDPDQKALYDAGFVNIDGDLTDDGEEARDAVLFDLAKGGMIDLAKQLNADAEKDKKAKK